MNQVKRVEAFFAKRIGWLENMQGDNKGRWCLQEAKYIERKVKEILVNDTQLTDEILKKNLKGVIAVRWEKKSNLYYDNYLFEIDGALGGYYRGLCHTVGELQRALDCQGINIEIKY